MGKTPAIQVRKELVIVGRERHSAALKWLFSVGIDEENICKNRKKIVRTPKNGFDAPTVLRHNPGHDGVPIRLIITSQANILRQYV